MSDTEEPEVAGPDDTESSPEPPSDDAPPAQAAADQDDDGPPADEAPAGETEAAPDLRLDLAAAEARAAEFKDKLLRVAADFDNYKRRAAREQEDARRYGNEALLKDLLPVLDNLERALGHAGAGEGVDTGVLLDGVTMVHKQYLDALRRHGVEAFDSQGEEFDPNLHEAIHRRETDAVPPGHVAEEFQKGYMVHGRLARPALVIVAAAPPEAAPPEAAPAEEPAEEPVEEPVEDSDPPTAGAVQTEDVLGVKVADATTEQCEALGVQGAAVVLEVGDLTPAARAGVEAGDVLTEAAGRPILDARSFARAVRAALPRHQTITVTCLRGDDEPRQIQIGGRRR